MNIIIDFDEIKELYCKRLSNVELHCYRIVKPHHQLFNSRNQFSTLFVSSNQSNKK